MFEEAIFFRNRHREQKRREEEKTYFQILWNSVIEIKIFQHFEMHLEDLFW